MPIAVDIAGCYNGWKQLTEGEVEQQAASYLLSKAIAL
jgi:hypothetical protein